MISKTKRVYILKLIYIYLNNRHKLHFYGSLGGSVKVDSSGELWSLDFDTTDETIHSGAEFSG